MARIGRPPSQRAATARLIYVKMRLYLGEDDDLIAFFEGIPRGLRAAMVKRALRSGVQVTVHEAEEESQALIDALEALVD